jgi:dephospho-CoA kinase
MTGGAGSLNKFSIGLTGGIGSGKSLVADLFARHGASVIDTDLIAHALTAPGGAAMPAIQATFGDAFLTADGALNRAAMREKVFGDPAARRQLEAILHPLIGRETAAAAVTASGPYLIYVVPLLVESGKWRDRVNRIVVVDCSEAVQRARVMKRSQLTQAQVEAIMKTQATRAARLAVADDIITNDKDKEAVEAEVARLHNLYLTLAAKK